MKSAALLAALLLPLAATAAETVYRCGQTYQAQPCDDGRAVEVADPRSAAQRRQAEQVARDEARRGQAMERERLAGERKLAAAARPHEARAPKAAASAPAREGKRKGKGKAKDAGGNDFIAVVPGQKK